MRIGRPIGGIALSPNGQRALVGPGRRSRKAVVISPRRGQRIRRISAGKGPTFVAFSPTGARIYFANSGSGTITFASGYSYRRLPGPRAGRPAHHRHGRAVRLLAVIGTPGPGRR